MSADVIFRVWGANEWKGMAAGEIAQGLNAPARLQALTLLQLFQAAVEGGASPAEFRALWGYTEFIRRFETGLQAGDYAGVLALLATVPVELSEGTLAAVNGVIGNQTVGAGEAAWGDEDGALPVFDGAWVESALSAAGWAWDGGQWVR